jgi:hypothetical protein
MGGWIPPCWGRLGLIFSVCERHGVDIIVAPHGAVEAAEECSVKIMDRVPTVAGCDCKRGAATEEGSDAGKGGPGAYAIAVCEDQRNKFQTTERNACSMVAGLLCVPFLEQAVGGGGSYGGVGRRFWDRDGEVYGEGGWVMCG